MLMAVEPKLMVNRAMLMFLEPMLVASRADIDGVSLAGIWEACEVTGLW